MTSRPSRIASALLLLALGACQSSKSSTPTAPTVAGPIPGVNITAPVMLEPAQGFKFKENEQPIRLVIQNATTNGQRALSYTFEVSSDSSFSNKVFSRSNIAPGGDNRTSLQIDRLEIGRAYYWRAWAQDGANTGAMATANFEIYPKAGISPPTPVSPVNGAAVTSVAPDLVVNNAASVGPVSFINYEFQVATDQAFSRMVSSGVLGEGTNVTTFKTSALANATTYFWRSRASDGETTSTWNATQSFRTPAAPAPPPPGGGGGGGGGGGNPGSCAGTHGPTIVKCIQAKYPDRTRPVGSFGERQANMLFLRDRIIEAGLCGGVNYGWNLKRGGPELSVDVIAWKRPDGNMGVDIAFDYDNNGTTLQLTWGEVDLFASYTPYTNSYSCGS